MYKSTGLSCYKKLAETVATLLEMAITADPAYRLQQIQRRAKTVESLRNRLEAIGQLDTAEIEAYRKDLAGCRIVFYTNSDVNRFLGSGLLSSLFEIDWERSKFHQPGPVQHSEDQLFQSHNYVVKLKSDRISLLEYREFEGLYCEIQVQTSLNHAWAEMAHDTIYKRPELQGFGTRQLELIESRLEDAMRKHLLPAGYLFQRIATDVDRLARGKALFDAGVLDAALAAKNNNDRHDLLVQLKDNVLPNYDDLPGVFPEISDKLKQMWLVAEATKTVSYQTPYGDYPGQEPHKVTAQIVEIMERCRFVDPDKTYTFIRDLFVQTSNSKSRDQLVNLAERLARPTMQMWERFGPFVQVQLADALSNETDIASISPVATTIASEILRPEIKGSTWSSSAVTYSRCVITYSHALEAARRTVVNVISGYARSAIEDDDALQNATTTLFECNRWPRKDDLQPQIAMMILADLAHAVGYMTRFACEASLNARQDLESMLFRLWRWVGSLPKCLASEPKVVEVHKRLIGEITAFREALNADEEFVIFKTIVGYKSIFPHQWEEGRGQFNRDETIRNQLQDELADSITHENWPIWKARLETAARVKSNDGATFPPYDRFLSAIATRQPRLAFDLLADRTILPDCTIRPIAHTLLEGGLHAEVEDLLGQWVRDGRFLSEIAMLASSAVDKLAIIVSKVTSRAVNDTDENACTVLIIEAIRRYSEDSPFWRNQVFFPCLTVLHRVGNLNWLAGAWHQSGKDSLFTNLTADQCQTVLAAMVRVREIDYPTEQILKSIAQKRHQMVLDWLGERIEIALQERSSQFNSIPFAFQCLHEVLQPHPRDVLAAIRQWFDRDDFAGRMDATYFLSKIYPEFQEPLPDIFLDSLHGANTEDLAFLAASLRGYNGGPELFPILRAILASDTANDDTETHVSEVLLETGVMIGEFGPAETYQAKVELLEPWLDDKNTRVAKFAAHEIHNLKNMIASENRRAQEGIAMRKLQYGEPLEDDDACPNGDNTLEDDPI